MDMHPLRIAMNLAGSEDNFSGCLLGCLIGQMPLGVALSQGVDGGGWRGSGGVWYWPGGREPPFATPCVVICDFTKACVVTEL